MYQIRRAVDANSTPLSWEVMATLATPKEVMRYLDETRGMAGWHGRPVRVTGPGGLVWTQSEFFYDHVAA